jgi:branched-chain amino acid transport system permease protein
VSFGLLCFVLLFMPTGLLGKPEVEKVWVSSISLEH